jgi:hypothetical protein
MNTEKFIKRIIDNSDNYFQLNELVYQTEEKDHLNRIKFKSLERNFSAFIYEIQTTPHAPAKNGTIQND